MKFKLITIPIYDQRVIIAVSNDMYKVSKKLGIDFADKEEPFASTYNGFKYKGLNTFMILLNFDYKITDITYGILAHECVHCADMIFDRVGQKHDSSNPEAYTYLVEYITDEVYRFLKENKLIKRIKFNKH